MAYLYSHSPSHEGLYLEPIDETIGAATLNPYDRAKRRLTDVITATAGLLLLFPLLAATGLAILLDSVQTGAKQ